MFASFLPSLRMLVVLSVLTGVIYPLATWGLAQLAVPRTANGSLIEQNGKAVGSALIGQPFDDPKYFAIIPAAFATTYPQLNSLNVMNLTTPNSAILSAVIFNALIIPALIPLALGGVKYKPVGAAQVLRTNMLIYGVGGVLLPFVGIKIIDVLLVALHLT